MTGAEPQLAHAWSRRDLLGPRTFVVLGALLLLHALAFGLLAGVVVPSHFHVDHGVFGIGLGLTAYSFGVRHAFDADHIAAIDNTTRKLVADGKRPLTTGLWFGIGHSAMVFILAGLVAMGAHVLSGGAGSDSVTHRALSLAGTAISGGFLLIVGAMNLVALIGIVRAMRLSRRDGTDSQALERALASRGFLFRILGPLTRSIRHPVQLLPVGMLFGLGFDTASEVALLVLAGSSAAAGLPWYAVLTVPLLFTCGMCLFDFLDGLLMAAAYGWTRLSAARRASYDLGITGLSVVVAFFIGTIDLVGILREHLGVDGALINWLGAIDLNLAGFVIVGLFVATWTLALVGWRVRSALR